MQEKNKNNEPETKTSFTFTVFLVKLLIVVCLVGLIWIIQMLISQSDAFHAVLEQWTWR